MNKEWSDLNKLMQSQIGKAATFEEGKATLFELRKALFGAIEEMAEACSAEDLAKMPFAGAEGYHSKTIAYSFWHIFRIEDIVAHDLILGDQEVFFTGGFDKSVGGSVITTGNELCGQEIVRFSKGLDVVELLKYCRKVKDSTEKLISGLNYGDLKRRFGEESKAYLRGLKVVSESEEVAWLVDYWCGKDVFGLIKMPFSRHWIMHIEAALRIFGKIRTSGLRKAYCE